MAAIEIRGLSKQFPGGACALAGIDLDIERGELLALVGPSGSGKTTLLRLLAGLDQATAGSIHIGGKDVGGVPPHQRNVALVFQDLALYSHLSVAGNLQFGLQREAGSRLEAGKSARIAQVAEMLDISHLLERYPAELSGGEQQRVALGRAIVRQPAALLLDEPLSSVDGPMRRALRRLLKHVQREIGVPTIYVTHNQDEALLLGDRVAVLMDGKIQQLGTPHEIYHEPANVFVAEFFGVQGMNLVAGDLERGSKTAALHVDAWQIDLDEYRPRRMSGRIICGFRPDDVMMGCGDLRGRVCAVESWGESIYVQIEMPSQQRPPQFLAGRQTNVEMRPPKPGAVVAFSVDTSRLHWFDPATGKRLET